MWRFTHTLSVWWKCTSHLQLTTTEVEKSCCLLQWGFAMEFNIQYYERFVLEILKWIDAGYYQELALHMLNQIDSLYQGLGLEHLKTSMHSSTPSQHTLTSIRGDVAGDCGIESAGFGRRLAAPGGCVDAAGDGTVTTGVLQCADMGHRQRCGQQRLTPPSPCRMARPFGIHPALCNHSLARINSSPLPHAHTTYVVRNHWMFQYPLHATSAHKICLRAALV